MNILSVASKSAAFAALLFAGSVWGAEFVVSEAARRRAADFIENEKQFHLGFLPTGKGRGQTLSERKGQKEGDRPCLKGRGRPCLGGRGTVPVWRT